MSRAIALALTLGMASAAFAQNAERLKQITTEGTVLAATWVAGAVAYRALKADGKLDGTRTSTWVSVPHEGGWLTVFGRADRSGAFVPAAAYRSDSRFEKTEPFDLRGAPELSGHIRAVLQARRTVGAGTQLGPLTPVVLETPTALVVYLLQESKAGGAWVMGGDHRLQFDKSGKKLTEHRKLHKGAVVVPRPAEPPPEGAVPTLFHNHVVGMDPLPSDTDVAFAIVNGIELSVASPDRNVYVIAPDGTISVEQPPPPEPKPKQ